MAEKEEITVAEAGRRGGIATRDRHGVEFLKGIAKRGGETTKRRWGHLFREFGQRGGRPRRPSLGPSLVEDMAEEYPSEKGG